MLLQSNGNVQLCCQNCAYINCPWNPNQLTDMCSNFKNTLVHVFCPQMLRRQTHPNCSGDFSAPCLFLSQEVVQDDKNTFFFFFLSAQWYWNACISLAWEISCNFISGMIIELTSAKSVYVQQHSLEGCEQNRFVQLQAGVALNYTALLQY